MEASSKPTNEILHSYDTLPYDQDFDLMISDAKFTADTRTDFYDRSLTSRKYALVGVACSSIFGCLCIIASIVILAIYGVSGVATTNTALDFTLQVLKEILPIIVTLCTESIGFVHGISLRSALASESRLRFNTNLRLLTAARGCSASLVICFDFSVENWGLQPAIAGVPLLILGVALLLQVMIALSAMRAVKILTWSSSPFDLTAALVHHTQLTPDTLRCMRCVSDMDTYGGPTKPREVQPSAWHAHPSIRKVVISLWWPISHPTANALTSQTWSFSPHSQSNFIVYDAPGVNVGTWAVLFVSMAVFQGPLTLGLHCSELIANVIRDERQWRCATGRKGLRTATNPVKTIVTHPICLVLFLAKPFLHWMFGQSFTISNPVYEGTLLVKGPWVFMFTAQVRTYCLCKTATTPSHPRADWNLCLALFIFACFFTFVALRRPRGPQPAAYGHVQTLANLVDEWSSVMWWGHKKDGIPYCHAGTSDHPLPDVKMDCVYAGSGAESRVPFS
ncbi:hypothetical protein DFJ58DRAFT_743232 [Suillus subalutaceus]|uniref:uncharacterized protein n=1 Tax=Suillus subalutaceus TaxID=48586 RepID=UPI001B86F803|nr:uncharacterized protein DFJ58DRAFT_743232 [Suillus subalutaceus]KAG1865896.1 hypothetical protein DFJ58DRAFT_743232 [Suillus subalutaceus]